MLIILVGCSQGKRPLEEALDYQLIHYKFNSPDCNPAIMPCFEVSLEYPEFKNGDSLAVFLANRIIKNSTLDFLGMGDVESTSDPDIEQAIVQLNIDFEQLRADFTDYTSGWQAKLMTKELYRSDSVLVLETSSMTYFGGAHPNHNIRYFNFNRHEGNLISPLILINDQANLTLKAERVFRETYNIKEGDSYKTAGFFFLGDHFVLPANIAFLGDSIRLHYNPYEIAPYAAGEFEITVSLD